MIHFFRIITYKKSAHFQIYNIERKTEIDDTLPSTTPLLQACRG
jgi:hypothetical protein